MPVILRLPGLFPCRIMVIMKIDLKARTKNIARNTAVGIIAQMIQIVSSFACRMVFVRALPQAYLGVNGLFSNILSILALSELGIGSAVTFELYSALAHDDKEQIKSLMRFFRNACLIIGSVITVTGLLILPLVGKWVPVDPEITEDIRVLYLFFLVNTSITYFMAHRIAILQDSQQSYILTLVHTAVTIVQNITQIIILLTSRNFLLYLTVMVLSTLAYHVICTIISGRAFPCLKEKDVQELPQEQKKRMFINTKDLFITSISGRLINQTDNIIITAFGGLVSTGLNSNYSLLIATLVSLTRKVNDAFQASIGNVSALENDEKKLALFNEVNFFFFWFYFWCTCSFIILVQDAIRLFFGASYVMAFSIAVITGVNFYTSEQGMIVRIFKETMGLFKYGKYVALFSGIINIFLSLLLGKVWGVFGILLASFISQIITTRWYFPYVTFKHGFHASPWIYYRYDVRYWFEGAAAFLATWYLASRFDFGMFGNLLYRGVLCIIIPNLILFLIHRKDPFFISIKARVLGILQRKK